MGMALKRSELSALVKQMQAEIPGFKLVEKRDSKLMWAAYYGLGMKLWNPDFMETMWTTLGRTVYSPYLGAFGKDLQGDYATMWHERRHLLDLLALEKKLTKPVAGLAWGLGYAFPQIFALGALGAFWSPWMLLCLLFLAPWPAPIRTYIEIRGYTATIEAYQKGGYPMPYPPNEWLGRIVSNTFCGWKYYKMSWRPKAIEAAFVREMDKLKPETQSAH